MHSSKSLSGNRALRARLDSLLEDKKVGSDRKAEIETALEVGRISNALLLYVKNLRRVEIGDEDKGAFVVSQELVERREYLKTRQQEKEYNQMMYGSPSDPNVVAKEDSNLWSSTRNNMSVIMNLIMSFVAGFAIAYYATKQYESYAETHSHEGSSGNGTSTNTVNAVESNRSLVFGLLGAIAALLIEMVLYIVRALQSEYKYEKGGKSKGKKRGVSDKSNASLDNEEVSAEPERESKKDR